MSVNQEDKLIKMLNMEMQLVDVSMDGFKTSLLKCRKIGIREKYTFEETESFDALTSKFARLSDIVFQKIFKTIILLLREDIPAFIDRINFLCKLNIIKDADKAKEIRDLRNSIVHEYFPESYTKLYAKVLELSQDLIEIIQNIKEFSKNKAWLKN
ncbi:MAG: hypothetical protein N3F09_05725 [Bacteroidia bacterium]|nr:hypothetical protein [Bacteroidia bacterium]